MLLENGINATAAIPINHRYLGVHPVLHDAPDDRVVRSWAELTPTMIKYLNLICEEFYLYDSGIMPPYLWRFWSPDLKSTLATEFAIETIDKYEFHSTYAAFLEIAHINVKFPC